MRPAIPEATEADPVRLLWTGGWDSTFRLLDLVVRQSRPVQPYYLRAATRPSSAIEIERMDLIRSALERQYPGRGRLVLPTRIREKAALHPDETISLTIARLRERTRPHPIGGQNDPLVRLARDEGVSDLELAIHRSDRMQELLASAVIPLEEEDGVYRLVDDPDDPDLAVFRCFRFPVFALTKRDMLHAARDRGFLQLMELTWFCYTPRRGQPCGVCAPCRTTRQQGLDHRFGSGARRRYEIDRMLRSARRLVRTTMQRAGLKAPMGRFAA